MPKNLTGGNNNEKMGHIRRAENRGGLKMKSQSGSLSANICFTLALFSLLLGALWLTNHWYTEKDLPPGYSIVVSTSGDKYSIIGDFCGFNRVSANVFYTKSNAVRFAKDWVKRGNCSDWKAPSDAYKWRPLTK